MSWFAENWIWVLFGVAFIAMHLFGHGGHGGHGSSGGGDGDRKNAAAKQAKGNPPGAKGGSRRAPHRH